MPIQLGLSGGFKLQIFWHDPAMPQHGSGLAASLSPHCASVILVANSLLMVTQGQSTVLMLMATVGGKRASEAWTKKAPLLPSWQRSLNVVVTPQWEADAANWSKREVVIKIIKKSCISLWRREVVSWPAVSYLITFINIQWQRKFSRVEMVIRKKSVSEGQGYICLDYHSKAWKYY